MTIEKNQGLIAAPFTPMNADKSVNVDVIPDLYHHYVEQGVKGVFINGSTSEGLSLTTEERKLLAEKWSDTISGDFKLLVHAGHTSLKDAKALAEHAAGLNVSGISTVGPFYAKPETVQQLVDFCTQIARSAPEIPFYYYHIPDLTGVEFSMNKFLMLASEQISNLAGIKFSEDDFMEFDSCQRHANEKYDILFGCDELMIVGLVFGARGFVGSTYNLFPKLYHEIIEAFNQGQLTKARTLQSKSIQFVQTIAQYGYNGTAKALMKHWGIDCGPVRLPLQNPEPSDIQAVEKELRGIDFFNYVKSISTEKV